MSHYVTRRWLELDVIGADRETSRMLRVHDHIYPRYPMARGRRDTLESTRLTTQRPLRILASGTLFVTNNLGLPTHPDANSVVRAHTVSRVRGGSASTCLSIIAQFPSVEASLVAPLGGNDEGQRIIAELERERVSTRYCKIWSEAGVPSAWVLHAGMSYMPCR